MAVHRAFSSRFRMDLPERPVISIGNLAMGGTGKTPMVRWLCRELAARGLRPAVLTRGYHRQSLEIVAALPGQSLPVQFTGEEAQLILRDGAAAVAIGADRQAARWKLASRSGFSPDLYILDDGFQHWRTRRELDIVLVDAIDPFRGGVFPKGRLREPFRALARASAVIITGLQKGREYTGLIEEIRRHNAVCPVFRAWLCAERPAVADGVRPGAFCGIGQPESFRRTLASLGIDPAFFRAFPDHHHYAESDIRPLLDEAPLLLTTEKDFLNLPAALQSHPSIRPVPARLEIDRPEELLRLVLGCLSAARGSSGS